GGMIAADATVTVSANNISTGGGGLSVVIDNMGGSIGGNAAINVNAANINANSLVAQIDNSNGGTIVGDATINMNVSGTATVTNDANIQILGNDPAGSA